MLSYQGQNLTHKKTIKNTKLQRDNEPTVVFSRQSSYSYWWSVARLSATKSPS